MFALSWVALAVAIGSLIFGLSQQGLTFIWVSIAASVVAMLLMLAGVLRRPVRPATAGAPYGPPEEAARRPEPAPAPERPAGRPAKPAAQRPARKPAATRPSKTAAAAPAAVETTERVEPKPAPPERKPAAKKPAAKKPAAKKAAAKAPSKAAAAKPASDRAQVVALPERGTYHLADCRIVKGRRDTEKIARGTAKRRGYNACGICKPAASA